MNLIGDDYYGTSPNRAYLAKVPRTSAQISLRRTSDMLGTFIRNRLRNNFCNKKDLKIKIINYGRGEDNENK